MNNRLKSPLLQYLPVTGGRRWTAVAEPGAWPWELPFTIQQSGRQFRPDPGFNIQEHTGVTPLDTYYVDSINGDNANDGSDWDDAFEDLTAIATTGTAFRAYIASGSYFYKSQRPSAWQRDCEIIALGAGATITSDVMDQAGDWSKTGTYYEAALTEYVADVYDETDLDANGYPTELTSRASTAEVDANPGSYYLDYGNKIYIRTIDDREPDSSIRLYDSLAIAITLDETVQYFDNITFLAAIQVRNSSATAGLKFYLNNCAFYKATIAGVDEVIIQNCSCYHQGDGANYDIRNTVITKAIEINCAFQGRGAQGSAQNSTAHNGCYIARINGVYHQAGAQNIADVSASFSWCLGCLASSAYGEIGFHHGDGTAWLDSCDSTGNTTDRENSAGGTIYHRDFVGEGADSIGGTLEAY